MIKVTNLSKTFTDYKGDKFLVLDNLNFNIKKGEISVILGRSGSGKSTLLNILAAIDSDVEGKVEVDDIDITKLNESQKAKFRNNNIGFIFQSHELIPEFNVLENSSIPLIVRGVKTSKAYEKAKILLRELGLDDEHFYKMPRELSGGQQQRVAIVRAVIHKPKIIFADEPTGNLDPLTRDSVIELIKNLKSPDRSIVIVTHDIELKNMLADRVFEFVYKNNRFRFEEQ